MFSSMMNEDTKVMTAEEISDKLDEMGSYLGVGTGFDLQAGDQQNGGSGTFGSLIPGTSSELNQSRSNAIPWCSIYQLAARWLFASEYHLLSDANAVAVL